MSAGEPPADARRDGALSCPRCGARDVWIEGVTVTARACSPLPGLERLRCRACGLEGERWRRDGAPVNWRA